MMKRFFVCVYILYCTFFYAQEEEIIEISDTRENFTVAITGVSTTKNSITGEYITSKVSEALKQDIQMIPSHVYGEEEIIEYRKILKNAELEKLQKQLSESYKQRDSAYLNYNIDTVEKKTEEISDQRERYKRLLDDENIEYVIENEKPVLYIESTEELSEPPSLQYLQKNNIDYFLFLKVFSSEDVFGVEIHELDFAGNKRIVAKEVGTVEDVFEDLIDDFFVIVNKIRGFTAYNFIVRTTPQDASIFIDGTFSGSGYYSDFVVPGEYEVSVKRTGFVPESETIVIKENDTLEYTYNLEPVKSKTFAIQTTPSNADVYIDSKPLGKSPVFVTSYDDFHVFQFSMENYKERKLIYENDAPTDLNVVLEPDYADIDELFEIRRWNFYRSFGSFILSIPISLFLSSYSAEFGNNIDYYAFDYAATTISLYGSIYLNIVLFGQTVVSLFEYIDIGNDSVRGEFFDPGK